MADKEKTREELFGEMKVLQERIKELEKAEEALRKNEEFFREVSENSSDIIIIVDRKGIITYTSPSIKRFTGYKLEELLGKNMFDFIQPVDLPRAIANFGKAFLKKETAIPSSFRIRHKDGSERILEGFGKNLLDHPVISGFIMNVRDVTERVKAEKTIEESEKRYRLVAENTTDYIWAMDMNLKYTYISPSVVRTRGYTAEEMMNLPLQETLTPSSFQVAVKVLKEEIEKEKSQPLDLFRSRKIELEAKRKDGSLMWTEVNVSFLREKDGRAIGIMGVTRDITERKKMEEESKRHIHELEVFQKASMDREERILELKEEVRRLKKELGRRE